MQLQKYFEQDIEDEISLKRVEKICATFDKKLENELLPPLWCWLFFNNTYESSSLGEDGHIFIKELKGLRRMWAGGRMEFKKALKIGLKARKQSKLYRLEKKLGKSGELIFITLLNSYYQNDFLCIKEEQDIVFKKPVRPKTSWELRPLKPSFSKLFKVNEPLLFRYSALSFNSHRIHYDYPYAREIEGYEGLVIHGPLLASFMLDSFYEANPFKKVLSFAYKGHFALCLGQEIRASGYIKGANEACLWIANKGLIAHSAKLIFKD